MGLARGEIPLTHAALHQLPSWRTAAHLRDLLMACGALPRVDRQILLFEQWHLRQLAAITDPGHQRLLRQYTTWPQLPKLHAAAGVSPLQANARNHAAGQFTAAARFLAWLTGRDKVLAGATQADIDDWHPGHPGQSGTLRGFLIWAITGQHALQLNIPPRPRPLASPSPAISGSPCSAAPSLTTPNCCAPGSLPASCSSTPSPSAGSPA